MVVEQVQAEVSEIESLLVQLKGVIAVKIIMDGQDITEIHVLADNLRNPKQLVRDIETVFKVKSNLSIDHRKISIVQIPDTLTENGRLKLLSTRFTCAAKQAEVFVELVLDEQVFRGQAKGPNTSSNRLRLAAEATIQAVELFLGTPNVFVLEEARELLLKGKETVVVYLTSITQNGEEAMFGIAAEKTDLIEATARGVLCAVNRRLSKIY